MINKKVLCGTKIIAHKIVYCDNIWMQGTGLILHSKDSVNDTAWWFRFNRPRKVTVTMFLVFFPVDMVFLDDKNRIVELKKCMKPFRNYTTENKVSSFLELECGAIRRNSLKGGMKIVEK